MPVIYKYTGGIPRLVNTLCDTALTCAYADNVKTISASMIQTAVEELQWLPYAKRINAQRLKKSEGRPGAESHAQQDQVQVIERLGSKLERLDTIATSLSTIAQKLSNIEALLRRNSEPSTPPIREGKSEIVRLK